MDVMDEPISCDVDLSEVVLEDILYYNSFKTL